MARRRYTSIAVKNSPPTHLRTSSTGPRANSENRRVKPMRRSRVLLNDLACCMRRRNSPSGPRSCGTGAWRALLARSSARVALSVIGSVWLASCAGTGSEMAARMERVDTELREHIDDLRRAADASYDREQALAARLSIAEERSAQLHEQVARQESDIDALSRQLDSLRGREEMRDSTPQPGISAAYRTALDDYRERRYKAALERFADVLSAAPSGHLADNSQYWMGECYYGLDEYRAALVEFTKVFAYSETEKDDDAQVMIARCQMALGESEEALSAFQKLLEEYPASEYLATAREEIELLRSK
ncbi:MAG TPA: tetratricopeptide repeat protein [Candidatus Latescibacteria bacterium]|nr:tetratricopeptide repeat protein [Candidatus Latescibacterota bacterium]